MTINWKNLAMYAVVGIVVIWAASELFQWNLERRLTKMGSTPAEEDASGGY